MFSTRDARQKGKQGNKRIREEGETTRNFFLSFSYIHIQTHIHSSRKAKFCVCIAGSLRYSCTTISRYVSILFHSLHLYLSLSQAYDDTTRITMHTHARNRTFPFFSRNNFANGNVAVNNLVVRAMLVRTWTCRKWKEKKKKKRNKYAMSLWSSRHLSLWSSWHLLIAEWLLGKRKIKKRRKVFGKV